MEISVPEGERLAKQTFNPRLGIVGGISILGTTGIVEPMSEKALVDTIRVELTQRRRNGADFVLLTPGNYGSDFIRQELGIDPPWRCSVPIISRQPWESAGNWNSGEPCSSVTSASW